MDTYTLTQYDHIITPNNSMNLTSLKKPPKGGVEGLSKIIVLLSYT